MQLIPPSLATNARRQIVLSILLTSAGLLTASCTQSSHDAPPPPSPSPSPAPQASIAPSPSSPRHWIQDQRLRQVMADLSRRVPSWPKGLPEDPEGNTRNVPTQEFDEVAALAANLSHASEQIPTVGTKIAMGEADRRGFLALAQSLHDQADRLHDAATNRRIEAMQQSMDAINSTCISCHSRYRDFSGQIDLSQFKS